MISTSPLTRFMRIPMRASAPGSLASAGRSSFRTIDAGIFQVGLMAMGSIGRASSGLGMLGLPITTREVHTCRPSWITLRVKSGSLTSTRDLRMSRWYQRQRSMLAMIVSMRLSFVGLSFLTVRASRLPVGGKSLPR